MNNRQKRNLLIIGATFLLLFVVISIFNELMFLSTTKTCGTFYKVGTSRYVDYYYYSYTINGEKYDGSLTRKELKIKSLDSLKKISCIEIEYSNYIYSRSRVIDLSVLKK